MTYDPKRHHRRSIRWFAYDYTQAGAYFVTVCTQDHHCLFGQIEGEEMRLNKLGRIVDETQSGLPDHYPHVELDAFVIMPNHVHMIIVLTDAVEAGLKPAPTGPAPAGKRHGLPEIVRAFKTFSSRRINEHRATSGTPVWQRDYYEHVIRGEESLNRIRRYIEDNPANWMLDHENPQAQCYDQKEKQQSFSY